MTKCHTVSKISFDYTSRVFLKRHRFLDKIYTILMLRSNHVWLFCEQVTQKEPYEDNIDLNKLKEFI